MSDKYSSCTEKIGLREKVRLQIWCSGYISISNATRAVKSIFLASPGKRDFKWPCRNFIAYCLNRQHLKRICANKCEDRLVNLWWPAEHWTQTWTLSRQYSSRSQCPVLFCFFKLVWRLKSIFLEFYQAPLTPLSRPFTENKSTLILFCNRWDITYIWRPCWPLS